jgi:hypothetical protein
MHAFDDKPFNVVHAISEEAKNFYLALGFNLSPVEPMTLMITLNDLLDSII